MSFVHFDPITQKVTVDATKINPVSYLSTYWLVQTVAHTRPYAKGKLLDVGCSQKPYAVLYTLDAHIGVDWPQTLHQQNQIDAFADASDLPFKAQTFDTVLCTEVLEHLKTPGKALAEMARVLKPGGYLLISVPFTFRVHEEPYDFFSLYPLCPETFIERNGISGRT